MRNSCCRHERKTNGDEGRERRGGGEAGRKGEKGKGKENQKENEKTIAEAKE